MKIGSALTSTTLLCMQCCKFNSVWWSGVWCDVHGAGEGESTHVVHIFRICFVALLLVVSTVRDVTE